MIRIITGVSVVLGLSGVIFLAAGCQSVTRVEYYEPTTTNAEYSVPTSEGVQGHGPVKVIEGKSGVPDFSDNKTFRFNLNVLGI